MLRLCVLSKFLLLLVFWAFTAYSEVPAVKVVVNPSVPSNEISLGLLRRVFSMRQTEWQNNQTIKVYVLENQHHIHQTFTTKMLGLFPYQLDRIWNKLVYSGLGQKPTVVANEQEMFEKVSQQPGAIGYLMKNIDGDMVKVIHVVRE